MRPDKDDIVAFLTDGIGSDGGTIELAWSPKDADAITCAEHFDDIDALATRAVELNKAGANMYFTPAALRDDVTGRAHDDDVSYATVLWTDLDSADAMHAPARRYGVCEPTVSVATRASPYVRQHLYWRLDHPILSGAEIRRVNVRIAAHMLGDLHCANPARVLRLPGTVRWPTEAKPIGPHYLEPWFYGETRHIYTAEDIEAVFPECLPPISARRRDYGVVTTNGTDWDSFLDGPIGEGERNVKLFRLTGKLLSKNLSPYLVGEIIQAVNGYHCAPPLDEGEVDALVNSCCKTALRGLVGHD